MNPSAPDPAARAGVPERVLTALAELRRAASRPGLPPGLAPEEARRAFSAAVAGALAPLDEAPLAYAFLMNVDLAATPELSGETAENEALAAIPEPAFLALVPVFAADASGSDKLFHDALPPERFSRLTGKIAFRLSRSQRPEARELLARLFEAGLLAMDGLPPDVQERLVAVRLADTFLAQREPYLAALHRPVDLESYRLRSRPTARVVPILIERGRFAEAAELVAAFAEHARAEDGRGAAAVEALGTMVEAGVPEAARTAFLAAGREEDRATLGRVLSLFGGRAINQLVAAVREAEDPAVKSQAAGLLLSSGGESTAALIELVEDPAAGGTTAAAALRALGGLEDGDLAHLAAETAARRVEDPSPAVRRAALRALCQLSPRGRFAAFEQALADPDPGVRREAVRGLGLSGDGRSLPLLRGMVELAERGGQAAEWDAAAAAIDALGHAGRSLPESREELSLFLSGFAGRIRPAGLLGRFRGRRCPPLVLLALAWAAGRIGDDRSREILGRLAKDPDPAVSKKAASFLSASG